MEAIRIMVKCLNDWKNALIMTNFNLELTKNYFKASLLTLFMQKKLNHICNVVYISLSNFYIT